MKQALWLMVAGVASAALFAAGCAKQGGSAARGRNRISVDLANALAGETDRSLSSQAPTVQALDVYQLTVPFGAVSRSQEFWKRVNETSVDVATYDLLQKNGFRVGVAPAADWSYFRAIIEQFPVVTKRMTITGGPAGTLELEMKKGVEFQNLAYLTDDNTLVARTYEHCEDAIAVAFQPAPRRPGQVRMTMCPLVRARRKKFEVSVLNEEREYDLVRPERLYDLNLCADIPVESFLVVAPCTTAKWASNLGTTFLVDEAPTEKVERVLIMVPRGTKVRQVGGLD